MEFDFVTNTGEDFSLEGLISDFNSNLSDDHSNAVQLKKDLKKKYLTHQMGLNRVVTSAEGIRWVEYTPDIPSFIDSTKDGAVTTIIIDGDLLFSFFCEISENINKFIKQLLAIPKGSRLNILIAMGSSDLSYFVIESGSVISNLIRRVDCTKVFNFDTEASLADLMIAMCCDEVYISDFASVSITKADDGANLPRKLTPVYKSVVKETYRYWREMGLFTAEDVMGIFTSESDNSIHLLADEIKKRLQKRKVQD